MEDKQRVFQWIEEHSEEMIELLGDMVKINSINQGYANSAEEAECSAYIADYMRKIGLKTEVFAFDPEKKRPNVLGTVSGGDSRRSLLFNAHIDTVPIGDESLWETPPLECVRKDDYVYGRGVGDDKGCIAAMLFAARAIRETGAELNGDMLLLASVGEESGEGGVYGTGPVVKALVDDGRCPEAALICENTGMTLQMESPSLLYFEVIVRGKATHASARNRCIFPQQNDTARGSQVGVDALEKLLPIIEMFYRKERDWNLNTMRSAVLGSDKWTGVGNFTINPCMFSGGSYTGIVPAIARITYGVWYPNTVAKEDVIAEIKESVAAIASTDSWLRENPPEVRIPILRDWPGFNTDRDSALVNAVSAAYEETMKKPLIKTGFPAVCDASWAAQYGVPSAVLGAGGKKCNVHAPNERCSIRQLIDSVKVYAALMMDWGKEETPAGEL